jgi:hypothetical protein
MSTLWVIIGGLCFLGVLVVVIPLLYMHGERTQSTERPIQDHE